VLGEALGGHRDEAVIVTKVGVTKTGDGQWLFDGSPQGIKKSIEESLQRLGTDYVDLLLVHRPDVHDALEETSQALQDIRQSGKARHVGVSNFNVDHVKSFLESGPLATNQVPYNLFDRRYEPVMAFCSENGMGAMAYGSLCFGLLTGAMEAADLETKAADWRKGRNLFGQALLSEENFPKNLAVVEKLKGVAARLGCSLPQLAVTWVLANQHVAVALTGCRKPSEIEDNVGALDVELSAEAKAEIEQIMQRAAGASQKLWL
jgi:aryl-alcohol dehydrogenase-like predicted oxidoreductase